MANFGIYIESRLNDNTENEFVEFQISDDDYVEIYPDGKYERVWIKALYENGVLRKLIKMPDDVIVYENKENE